MARHITEVADGLVFAVASQVTRHPTVVARLLVGAVGRQVPLLVAVIAQPHVAGWQWGDRAVPNLVARLAASVAYPLVRAGVGRVPGLSAVPT